MRRSGPRSRLLARSVSNNYRPKLKLRRRIAVAGIGIALLGLVVYLGVRIEKVRKASRLSHGDVETFRKTGSDFDELNWDSFQENEDDASDDMQGRSEGFEPQNSLENGSQGKSGNGENDEGKSGSVGDPMLDGVETSEEEEKKKLSDLETQMDMEDEDMDEFERFGGDVGEWLNEVDRNAKTLVKKTADSTTAVKLGKLDKESTMIRKPVLEDAQKKGEQAKNSGRAEQGSAQRTGANPIGDGAVASRKTTKTFSRSHDDVSTFVKDSQGHNNSKLYLGGVSQVDTVDHSKGSTQGEFFNSIELSENHNLQKVSDSYSESRDLDQRVFSTDDEMVDDAVTSRLEELVDIEDALLIKREQTPSGGGHSRYTKEKWGKVLLGPLNPANNPLLQDPDTLGSSGDLTRSDAILLKALKWTSLETTSTNARVLHRGGLPQGKLVRRDSREATTGLGSTFKNVSGEVHNKEKDIAANVEGMKIELNAVQ